MRLLRFNTPARSFVRDPALEEVRQLFERGRRLDEQGERRASDEVSELAHAKLRELVLKGYDSSRRIRAAASDFSRIEHRETTDARKESVIMKNRLHKKVEYVPLASLQQGPKLRERLTEAQELAAKSIWERIPWIRKQHPDLKTWFDGFCHDQTPDRELRIWAQIAEYWEIGMKQNPTQDGDALFQELLEKSVGLL